MSAKTILLTFKKKKMMGVAREQIMQKINSNIGHELNLRDSRNFISNCLSTRVSVLLQISSKKSQKLFIEIVNLKEKKKKKKRQTQHTKEPDGETNKVINYGN